MGGPDPHAPLAAGPQGDVVPKWTMVDFFREAAGRLGLNSATHTGAAAWGGHSLRRGGAQYFGAAGVEVWRIQALARHSSDSILTYLADSHVGAITNIAAEAAMGRSLEALKEELRALKAAANASGAQVPAQFRPAETPVGAFLTAGQDLESPELQDLAPSRGQGRPPAFVAAARKGAPVHICSSRRRGWTRCGWRWSSSPNAVPCDSPFGRSESAAAPQCHKCIAGSRTSESASGTESNSPPG